MPSRPSMHLQPNGSAVDGLDEIEFIDRGSQATRGEFEGTVVGMRC
jgi:hypothetical protein